MSTLELPNPELLADNPTLKPCSWNDGEQCLKGLGAWQPFLMVWSKNQDGDADPCMRISLRGILYCDWCSKNRGLDSILPQREEVWLIVRRAFHQAGKIDPDRKRIKLGWEYAALAPKREIVR